MAKADRNVRIESDKVDRLVKLRLSSALAASPEVGPLPSVMPYPPPSAMRRTGQRTDHRPPKRRATASSAARQSWPARHGIRILFASSQLA
jgi:hypothetical protein